MDRLLALFKTFSLLTQAALIGGLLLLLLFAANGIRGFFLARQVTNLQQQQQELQTKYDRLIGESNAQIATAREDKLKADAKVAAIEQGKANIRQIEAQLQKAVESYEKKKSELGDCSDDPAECQRLLCEELRAAGFKCP